jgi:uncharacterized protein with FMN-binding domain
LRRAVLTLGGTVAGLAALFSFKSHAAVDAAAVSTPTAGTAAASAPAGISPSAPSSSLKPPTTKPSAAKPKAARHTPTTSPSSHQPTAPATTKSSPPASPTAAAPKTYTGDNENTQYGPMQVQITVTGSKITAVNELQQPDDSIASNAISQLDAETLSAQSASIQAVSGATYTSNGYIKSLQNAVDMAGR